jgi:hypothetical protein
MPDANKKLPIPERFEGPDGFAVTPLAELIHRFTG